jgi:hypothetical protein
MSPSATSSTGGVGNLQDRLARSRNRANCLCGGATASASAAELAMASIRRYSGRCTCLRVVGDPREPSAQLGSSRQLTFLIEDSTDRGGISLSDNEHSNSMAALTAAGKHDETLPSCGMRPAKRGVNWRRWAASFHCATLSRRQDRMAKKSSPGAPDSVERLREENATLGAAVQARDDFISVAAHELRNPMTPLVGHIELLRRHARTAGDVVPAQIVAGIERLDVIVHCYIKRTTALLDISRLTKGSFDLLLPRSMYRPQSMI